MIVVVGTGLAAVCAVEGLRDEGCSAPIMMVGAERDLPYDRPPLSKEFLRGETTLEAARIRGDAFYREHNVELVLGAAAKSLDTHSRELELEHGRRIPFDKLLIATGASARRLPVPGAELDGVLTLRTGADALHLKTELARAGHVVVVGGGFIGLEVASAARAMGKHVTVVEAAPQPLARLLHGERVAGAITQLHRDHGVVVHTSTTVTEFCGAHRVEEVVLSTGERIPADVVLVAVGVEPSTRWLAGSGIRLDDGVLTNASLETNVPGIYAAGDVARALQPGAEGHARFEHYGAAYEQGVVAGRLIAGGTAVPNVIPGAGSEQFGVRMQVLGRTAGADRVVVRGSLEARTFAAFFLVEGAVRGAFLMNRVRELPVVRKLVLNRACVDERRIADESQPLVMPAVA
ncbi:Ferredoxin reductase [Labilithrix luteola]|uniref:Ferredoxin reductase n=1 Tax=Labilithrix luteola TaxID=1391654 RepID=A0A0K1PN61_9BACT|nr:FAD-dependent oxidoreductase [Labilithrix luteola]AKU94952.1 Ferredoxin reductase [Labilithrix luteola]